MFIMVTASLYSPTSNVQRYLSSHILPNTYFPFLLLTNNATRGYEVIFHCGFDLHLLMTSDIEYLLMCLLTICMSFWRNVCSCSLPILKTGLFVSLAELLTVLYIL